MKLLITPVCLTAYFYTSTIDLSINSVVKIEDITLQTIKEKHPQSSCLCNGPSLAGGTQLQRALASPYQLPIGALAIRSRAL